MSTSPALRADVERTVAAYRCAVRAIATVVMTHWPSLSRLPAKGKGSGLGRCQAIEALFHATAARTEVRYPMLGRFLGKMPSYLRRAAIEHAYGVVSSFLSNYDNWLDGEIGDKARAVGAKPPRLGFANVFPPLYGGNMILVGVRNQMPKRTADRADFVGPRLPRKTRSVKQEAASAAKANELATPLGAVRVKLLGAAGAWSFSVPLELHGHAKRMLPTGEMGLLPTLMQRGAKVWLSCPVELRRAKYLTNKEFALGDGRPSRVCTVDVGINTAATAAIVDTTGTVIARGFFTHGRHNDRRDELTAVIAEKQSLSGSIKKGERHCVALHRRVAGCSLDAARTLASEIAAFAALYGAKAFVIEDLKGWKPKGPSRTQRKRFHRFQHRAFVGALAHQAEEMSSRIIAVHARGTSRWAYDGSGKVKRSKENAQLATFSSGKQYNADLNGALNIAARGLAMLLGIKPRDERPGKPGHDQEAGTGKSSGPVERMPLVLADVWAHAQTSLGCSNRRASPAGVLA